MRIIQEPEQHYAECGCSEESFRFSPVCSQRIFEIRYWLAIQPEHNHRMDKVRVYLVKEEGLAKVS